MSKKRITESGPNIRNANLIGAGGKQVRQVNGSFAEGAIQAGKGPKPTTPSPKGPTP